MHAVWREAHVEANTYKHRTGTVGPLLEVGMLKECPGLWCEAHYKVKMSKALHVRAVMDVQMSFRVAGATGYAPGQRRAKTWRFSSMSRNVGRRGACEEDLRRCTLRGRGTTRDAFIRDVRRSRRRFLE